MFRLNLPNRKLFRPLKGKSSFLRANNVNMAQFILPLVNMFTMVFSYAFGIQVVSKELHIFSAEKVNKTQQQHSSGQKHY